MFTVDQEIRLSIAPSSFTTPHSRAEAHSSLHLLSHRQLKQLRMRNVLKTFVLLPAAIALAAPDFLADFQPAVLQESPAQNNDTVLEEGRLELLKRQTDCATGYSACNNINQPGLCCQTDQVCSADGAGHAACCPKGAACTGTIVPVGQNTDSIAVSTATQTTTTAAAGGGGVTITPASTINPTSTDTPFIQQSSSIARSTVSNQFYPFPYIPTTYVNAAACSSAYTSCQSDAASCTAALASGQQGVTISAPNGGMTVTAVASVGTQSAESICSSLSLAACSGLKVAACQAFGTGNAAGAAPTRCADVYRVGAGVALGIAGQLLR